MWSVNKLQLSLSESRCKDKARNRIKQVVLRRNSLIICTIVLNRKESKRNVKNRKRQPKEKEKKKDRNP